MKVRGGRVAVGAAPNGVFGCWHGWLWTWRPWRRSGQQLLNRGLQVSQRLAIEPGAIGDPSHAQFTELGQVRASWTGIAIDRPRDTADQGGDVLLVADADRVNAVGPGPQVEATSAYRLRNPLLPGHPRCWQEGVDARVDDDRDPGVVRGGPDCRQPPGVRPSVDQSAGTVVGVLQVAADRADLQQPVHQV